MRTLTSPTALPDTALETLFLDARTVNAFAGDDVDPAEVYAAYDVLRWGPTAMNTSPLRLAVVPRGERRDRLVAHMSEANRAKTLAAPLVVIAASDPAFHSHLDVLAPHRTGLAEALEPQLERREQMARSNAHIQIGYLVLALRARGLHVGPMGGFDAGALDADLLADTGWRSHLVLNVGWEVADGGTHPRADRLTAQDAVVTL